MIVWASVILSDAIGDNKLVERVFVRVFVSVLLNNQHLIPIGRGRAVCTKLRFEVFAFAVVLNVRSK